MVDKFTDFAVQQDSEGVFDILVDAPNGDFVTTNGEDSALLVSLFSDRRAHADEVANTMHRRGWIGDLVSDVLGDRHGSGLWLYEQRRLTPEVASGIRTEAEQALTWMVEQSLVKSVSAEVSRDQAKRSLFLNITCALPEGGSFSESYTLANNTRTGLLAQV